MHTYLLLPMGSSTGTGDSCMCLCFCAAHSRQEAASANFTVSAGRTAEHALQALNCMCRHMRACRYTSLDLPLSYNLNFRFLESGTTPGGEAPRVVHFADRKPFQARALHHFVMPTWPVTGKVDRAGQQRMFLGACGRAGVDTGGPLQPMLPLAPPELGQHASTCQDMGGLCATCFHELSEPAAAAASQPDRPRSAQAVSSALSLPARLLVIAGVAPLTC